MMISLNYSLNPIIIILVTHIIIPLYIRDSFSSIAMDILTILFSNV